MTVTSVSGHLLEMDFVDGYSNWNAVDPALLFFNVPIQTSAKKNKDLATQLKQLSRNADLLILWLDCDREGEAIGYEVLQVCQGANARLPVLRAHFSALIPRDIHQAMRTLTPPNPHLRDAVVARQEMDLRIGAAFTRFQSVKLKKKFSGHEEFKTVLSYGPCQFPTLGFVVERFLKRKSFVEQAFWTVKMEVKKDGAVAQFEWERKRLFDRWACVLLYEEMVEEGSALITRVDQQRTTKSRPVPLSTVEMQKHLSRPPFRLSAHASMEIAEKLYQNGYISYPRTETDKFKAGTGLPALIGVQSGDPRWGAYANNLLQNGAFLEPRDGGHDDGAHPPIHPTKSGEGLAGDEAKVYEFVTRHFLACCSKDAVGMKTTAIATIAREHFRATGLMVLERNFLDVYPYEHWADHAMPIFNRDDRFVPSELRMRDGKTEPPPLLSECDLISAMDKNGIGTDATIAQHIKTIQDRRYAVCVNHVFQPTPLGLGLVEGYDNMNFHMSQPTLRAHMESELRLVSEGLKSKDVVIHETLTEMKRVFDEVASNSSTLEDAVAKYFPVSNIQMQTLAVGFSKCGCGGLMDLKQAGTGQYPTRTLVCVSCQKSLNIPSKNMVQPFQHVCPICQFQVLEMTNEETQKKHTICPNCFNYPPQQDMEDIAGGASSAAFKGFRCFQCTRADCALSNKQKSRSNEPVRTCDRCGQMMTLKSFPSGGTYLGCAGFPACANRIVLPCKEVEITSQECATCLPTSSGFRPKLLKFTFSSGQAPLHLNHEPVCVGGCDDDINDLFHIYKRTGAAQPPSAPQQQRFQPPQQPVRPPSAGPASAPAPAAPFNSSSAAPSIAGLPSSAPIRSFPIQPRSRADPVGFVNADRASPTNFVPSPSPAVPKRKRGESSSNAGSRKKNGSTRGRGSKKVQAFNRSADQMDESNRYAPASGGSNNNDFQSSYRQQQQERARGLPTNYADQSSAAAASSSSSYNDFGNNSAAAQWSFNSNANQARNSSNDNLSHLTCYRCHQPGHLANACPNMPANNFRGGHSNRGGGSTWRGGNATNRGGAANSGRDNATCFNCHQPGHWSKDCPNRK